VSVSVCCQVFGDLERDPLSDSGDTKRSARPKPQPNSVIGSGILTTDFTDSTDLKNCLPCFDHVNRSTASPGKAAGLTKPQTFPNSESEESVKSVVNFPAFSKSFEFIG
jgi:hypothetical protein